ncbi:SAM-dependent methyltransferase [Actinacidiphila sp. bgisy160]|uniref:SAM-dependent methyltransferase n=1 Tax=Actinacidiphila sp. bgisy160 TaxID=3413796 RepID=UPI003D73BCC1
MTTSDTAPFTPRWLALREDADAAARAADLLGPLREHFAGVPRGTGPLVVRDLGCGTGSMGRWLSGRLPGPQHWILHDHDAALLALAAASLAGRTAGGSPVTAETREGDLTRLTAADLAGTSLVTGSALLDLLTADEIDALAATCAAAAVPVLFGLSVVGEIELGPADPLDADITAAFNAHQRRTAGGRALLGPDALDAATRAFTWYGATVTTRASPWRLGADQAALTAEWLRGWVGAAVEQEPALAAPARAYLHRRLEDCAAGRLTAVVGHGDLLALPGGAAR